MARLIECTYPGLPLTSIHSPLLFVVDMIEGFTTTGALADPAILEISPAIEKLIQDLDCETVFIRDCHAPDAREFESYPIHCLDGDIESEIISSLKPYVKRCIPKNSTNTFMAEGFQRLLEEDGLAGCEDLIVTGCCTDICILHFVLALQTWLNENNVKGKRIIVPVNCVDTYDIPKAHDACFWNDVSLAMMAANGITVVSSIEG